MARTKRWVWSGLDRGFGEVRISSWKYFTDFVYQEMLDFETYIWRGERCDNWLLEPTLDRLVRNAKIAKTKRYDFRASHLEQFKFAARGRRGSNPPVLETENDWWALGQHHGLATPLLDWSLSPFVAAYFAFIEVGEKQTNSRAVYALHRPSIELMVRKIVKAEDARKRQRKEEIESGKAQVSGLEGLLLNLKTQPEVEFVRPLSDENQRLVNQGGLFSRSPSDKTLDAWVQEHHVGDKGYTLIKILLPNKDRDSSLRTLNRMNINHLSLFPDLYGASKFCNLFSEIDRY
jgi:hypothetical protein